jgi:hypothetical protein
LKQIAEQAAQLVTEAQMIADNLAAYNPGLCKDKIPLEIIQYDLGCLGRELTWLYAEIEKKVKNVHR